MDIILLPLLEIITLLIATYKWAIIVYAVLSMLIGSKSITKGNQLMNNLYDFLHSLIDPFASRVRKVIPTIGRVDISLFVVFLIVWFLERMLQIGIAKYVVKYIYTSPSFFSLWG